MPSGVSMLVEELHLGEVVDEEMELLPAELLSMWGWRIGIAFTLTPQD